MMFAAYYNMSEGFFQMMCKCYLEFNCIFNDCMKHSARLLETGRFGAMCLTPLALASEPANPLSIVAHCLKQAPLLFCQFFCFVPVVSESCIIAPWPTFLHKMSYFTVD